MTAAVSVSELRFGYPASGGRPAREALRGVSFTVARGEIFGLLGPNGGGKSTLFRILATLAAPGAGRASVFGLELPGAAASLRPRLGVLFQSPSLDAKLTVAENMRHQGRLYGLSGAALSARIAELLERYGLAERRDEPAGALSGGLKRRVELAKCLLHGPELLILDEPSTGLDPGARRELWSHLLELRTRTGATVLVTTHLMEEAERCDRLALLDRGLIAAAGAPGALKGEIGGDVITIESEQPEALAAGITERFGVAPAAVDGTLRLEREKGHAFIPQLVEAFPGLLRSVSLSKPTLEDVFIHHTGRRLGGEERP